MLKAVRRSRSHRPLVDAVVSGSGAPAHAGEKKTQRKVQIEEPLQGGGIENDSRNDRKNEGVHGPTAPYNPPPNAVIPAPAAAGAGGGASMSVPSPEEVHQTAAEPAIKPRKRGPGHATTGQGYGAPPIHNVDIPPVRFPDGRNPYLDRPLPLPPPLKQSSSIPNLTLTATTTSAAHLVVAAAVPAPLKIARPIMPARPSTSSGPMMDSSSVGMGMVFGGLKSQSSFDRRISRDDMALEVTTQMGMVRTNKGLQPYRIGIKGGGLPTPEQSPNAGSRSLTSPIPGPSFVPDRVMTPESLSSGEIQIGMALGSPSHATFMAGWEAQQEPQPQQQVQMSPQQPQGVYSPPLIQEPQPQAQLSPPQQEPQRERTPEPSPAAPIQRQKTQKRRLFGLFGRKNVEPPKAADVIEASNSSISLASNSSQTQGQGWQVKVDGPPPTRSNTAAGKRNTSKFRPLISRSGTENDMSRQQPQQQASAAPQLSGPGLLDIEIPDIRLERYSIMFSGVLGTNQPGGQDGQSGPGGPSSLLARRQATLEKLKTINDRIQDEEDEKMRNKYRRATSPQPMNSPVFTLFPTTPARHPRPPTLAPGQGRMRSNTSPALLPSPSKGSFDQENLLPIKREKEKEKKTVTIISPRTMDERTRAAQVEKLREQQRATVAPPPQPQPTPVAISAFRFGPEESALILDSPSSMTSSSDHDDADDGEPFSPLSDADFDREDSRINFQPSLPLKPRLAEPQWEIISPPSTTTTSPSESSSKVNTSTGASTLSSSPSSSTLSSMTNRPANLSSNGVPAAVVITRKKSTKTQTQVFSDEEGDDGDDPDLKAAVEISIARQISISRQQRQMLLKPVQRSNTIASNNGRRPPPIMVVDTTGGNGTGKKITRSVSSPNREIAASIVAGRAAVTDNGRVVETRLGVPRLVSSGNSPGNRKSERVVLEVL